jgi:hypothetical protein
MFNPFLVSLQSDFFTSTQNSLIMRTTLTSIIFSLSILFLYSCGTTSETINNSNNNRLNAPMQQQEQEPQIDEERAAAQQERTGITYEEVQKLNAYAEQKGELICQMAQLQKDSEGALSEPAAREFKDSIITLDTQLTTLGKEIDVYCNTEARRKYFYQILKQHTVGCQ